MRVYDLLSDDPACVCELDSGHAYGLTVALQDSVLILAQNRCLLPVDLRAENPTDWKIGASIGDQKYAKAKTKTKAGSGIVLDPFDVGYAYSMWPLTRPLLRGRLRAMARRSSRCSRHGHRRDDHLVPERAICDRCGAGDGRPGHARVRQ
jgi:hypothetical protein